MRFSPSRKTLTPKTEGRSAESRRASSLQKAASDARQRERENRLHRQFKRVEIAVNSGKSIREALKRFEFYWRCKNYRSDPTKKVCFGWGTLFRLYRQWRKGGCVPAALRLKFRGLKSSVPAPAIVRFVAFCATLRFPSLKAAWLEFARRKGAFGRGGRGTKPVQITYGQLQYVFSGRKFVELQRAQESINAAQNHLAVLRAAYTADVRRRCPDHPRRRRVKKEVNFEI